MRTPSIEEKRKLSVCDRFDELMLVAMSSLALTDLTKVCRGCLGKNGEMRPLFGSSLDNMLQAVAEVEVNGGRFGRNECVN